MKHQEGRLMIGPALRRLVSDLQRIEDRSPYEQALLRELSPLLAAAAPFLENIQADEEGWPVSDQPDATVIRIASSDRPGIRVVAEILVAGGGPRGAMVEEDIVRLHCVKPDCPNKRL